MADLAPARAVLKTAPDTIHGQVVLDYDARLMRRKRLVTTAGEGFLVDLPAVTNLDDFWGFLCQDGRAIEVLPAEEHLVEITGANLIRLAWHIGNRHTPCQIEPKRLLIRKDHVLESMLQGLGAKLKPVFEPFKPEGGAYGHGRTMGHDHGDHTHAHHDHGLSPAAAPAQAHSHPLAPEESFGWHHHGDGKLHFHAPPKAQTATALPELPYGAVK